MSTNTLRLKMSVQGSNDDLVDVLYDPAVLGIVCDGVLITHPLYSLDGSKVVDPQIYGFEIWQAGGGLEILGMNLPNGDCLHLTADSGVHIPDEEDVEFGIIGRYTKLGALVACATLKDVPIQK